MEKQNSIREILKEIFNEDNEDVLDTALTAIYEAIKKGIESECFMVNGQDDFEKGRLYGYRQALSDVHTALEKAFK